MTSVSDEPRDQAGETAPAPAGFNVIALILREFTRQPVAEQARLKSRLEALAAFAIQQLSPAERIMLESPDGLVIVVLAGPEDALDVAERAQAGSADLPLCIAVNHGPVKTVAEASSGPRFVGDGIVSAVTLANLATRGRLLVSRPFREVLGASAPHRARTLISVGALTDATVRTHELFTPDPRVATTRRRQLIIAGSLATLGILGTGVAARVMREKPAVIQFEITPQGDIFVDGELKGRSPPLTQVAVSPGAHTIEVRNDPYAPLKLQMKLKPAEEIKVTHSFSGRKPRKGGDSFIEDVWRRLTR